MDTGFAALATRVLQVPWAWSPADIERAMREFGFGEGRPVPDALEFSHEAGWIATARLGDDGADTDRVESVSVVLVEDSDSAGHEFDKAASELRRALGPEVFEGAPEDGTDWGSWADTALLWTASTVWLMLQDRQDDTDLPRSVCLVWTAPLCFRLPPPAVPRGAPPHTPALTGVNEIEVSTRDGQTLRGTPVEIVRAMQANAATWLRIKTLPDYIAAEVAIAQRAEDLELSVAGDTDEALARSYVTELLRVGGMRETQRR